MQTPLDRLPPDLLARVRALLAALSKLSEARAGRLGGTRLPNHDYAPPPGTELAERQPDPDEWLQEWYVWKLNAPTEDPERYVLAITVECEIRLSKRTHRAPADLRAGSLLNAGDTEGRNRRIAQEYEGLTPLEVSIIEFHRAGACSEENVRRTRLDAGRDPDTGMRLHPDALLKGEAQRKRARELIQEGHSQREIARRLRISHPTVGRWVA